MLKYIIKFYIYISTQYVSWMNTNDFGVEVMVYLVLVFWLLHYR